MPGVFLTQPYNPGILVRDGVHFKVQWQYEIAPASTTTDATWIDIPDEERCLVEIAVLHKTPEVTFSIPQTEGPDEVIKVNLQLMTMTCMCGVRRAAYRLRRIAVLADEGSPAVHPGGVNGQPSDQRGAPAFLRGGWCLR